MNFKSYIKQLVVIIFIFTTGYSIWEYKLLLSYFFQENIITEEKKVIPITLVDIKKIRLGTVKTTLEVLGSIMAKDTLEITSEVPGIVESINFKEGTSVKKGQVLLTLKSVEKKAEVKKWIVIVKNRKKLYLIGKKLYLTNNIATTKLDALSASLSEAEAELEIVQAQFEKKTIKAPFSGYIGLSNISIGSYIKPGEKILTLDAVDPIELDFEVPETSLSNIKKDTIIIAKTRAYDNLQFEGKIKTINTRINPSSRSLTIRASFANSKKLLKPGMFMVITMPIAIKENAIIIPEESVITNGNKRTVFIYRDGKTLASTVKLGERLIGEVEVLEGLIGDEYLIVGGIQKIRDGQKVQPRK